MIAYVFIFLMGLVLATQPAHAQDIAIKPNNATHHPADLGIVSKPTAPTPAPTPSAPVTKPAPVQALPEPVVTAPAQPTLPPPSPPSGDVQIVSVSDNTPPKPPSTGPNTLSVTVQNGILGTDDKMTVNKMLGLTEQQMASSCVFEHMIIGSTKGLGFAVSLGQKSSGQEKFSNDLTNIMVFPTLACRKIRQPVSGVIIDQGGYYKVSLQSVTCPTPPRGGSLGLSFRYMGDGKGECGYR